jgi:enoyl-CoA hydratase
LKDTEGRSRRTMDIGALRRHLKLGPRLSRAWQEMEQITIAAIEGFCIGGGVALAVALDFRIIGRDAHLRVPEIGLGMNMSWQSIPRMLHLIGPARTKQAVILADQRISAEEAFEWGLVEEVVDSGGAFDAAMAMAMKVAAQPPISVAMTKLTINRLTHALDDLASHMDVDQFALASLTEDHKEGVAAFLGRRRPRFKGR